MEGWRIMARGWLLVTGLTHFLSQELDSVCDMSQKQVTMRGGGQTYIIHTYVQMANDGE